MNINAVLVVCCTGLYPNVSLEDQSETPEFTQPGVLFVYNWPVEEQAICPGTVTALEYCYQMGSSSRQEEQTILTLLLLDSSYEIIQTINVTTATTQNNCSDRGRVITCCSKQQLMLEQTFQVPGSNVTSFRIFSKTGEDNILAFGESSSIRSITGFMLVADAVIINNQVRVSQDQEIIIQYLMFNFAIGNKYEYSMYTESKSMFYSPTRY